MSLPYPEYLTRGYPRGTTPDRRMIKKCSDPKAWYKNMIGQIITVHYFATFGAWDTQGRWLWYYDLSEPVEETASNEQPEKKTSFFKKLFK